MKRKILKLIRDAKAELIQYKSYRSDMGCQVYDIHFKFNGEYHILNDSYFVGCSGGCEYIITELKKLLIF